MNDRQSFQDGSRQGDGRSPGTAKKAGGVEIIRAPRTTQFEIIPVALLRDARLSYRARGIATRLLSNVDGYRMTVQDLANEGIEGREAIRSALKELENIGYLRRFRRQNSRGQWITETIIRDTCPTDGSADSTEDGFPGAGYPSAGQPNANHPPSGKLGAKSTIPNTSTNSSTNNSTRPVQRTIRTDRKNNPERPRQHHGLYVFGDRDQGQIDELVREYGTATVETAAAAVRRFDRHGRPVAYVSEARRWLQFEQSTNKQPRAIYPAHTGGPSRSLPDILDGVSDCLCHLAAAEERRLRGNFQD